MIKKMSSHDFNNILKDTNKKIEDMTDSIYNIKNNIDKKLLIINHENEYLNYTMNNMMLKQKEEIQGYSENAPTLVLLTNNHNGLFETYSNIVHAYFKKSPINVFNLKSVNNPKSYFRDEVLVSINDIYTDYYKNILIADDNSNKQIFFEEYESKKEILKNKISEPIISTDNQITLSIEVDKKKIIGISKFNMIEIDPYLYKSFDIDSINIYGDDYTNPIYTSNKLESVGKTRIILDKKYDFKKVDFKITPKYSIIKDSMEVIPFGLKHIYFFEADFRNDSYLIVEYQSNRFIDYIENIIDVINPFNTYESSLTEQGIKIFLENNNGVLENEQEPSKNVKKHIARNLKKIYFKVPIGNNIENNSNYRNSIIALKIDIHTR